MRIISNMADAQLPTRINSRRRAERNKIARHFSATHLSVAALLALICVAPIESSATIAASSGPVPSAAADEPIVSNRTVPALTRFLEDEPLNPVAKRLRVMMMDWKEKSTDVNDVVCAGVLTRSFDEKYKYSGELFAQFILGSATHQLGHAADKGKVGPSHLAGMSSLLLAYQSLLAADPKARAPALDKLAKAKAVGKLDVRVEELVGEECSGAAE